VLLPFVRHWSRDGAGSRAESTSVTSQLPNSAFPLSAAAEPIVINYRTSCGGAFVHRFVAANLTIILPGEWFTTDSHCPEKLLSTPSRRGCQHWCCYETRPSWCDRLNFGRHPEQCGSSWPRARPLPRPSCLFSSRFPLSFPEADKPTTAYEDGVATKNPQAELVTARQEGSRHGWQLYR